MKQNRSVQTAGEMAESKWEQSYTWNIFFFFKTMAVVNNVGMAAKFARKHSFKIEFHFFVCRLKTPQVQKQTILSSNHLHL